MLGKSRTGLLFYTGVMSTIEEWTEIRKSQMSGRELEGM